jgi:hypothetical protein
MTDDRSLERAARSWLDEGPTRAPDRAMHAALSRIQTTRQDRALPFLWRLPTISPLMRLAGAAVAGALAVGLALFVLRPGTYVGAPGATPTVSPNPSEVTYPSNPPVVFPSPLPVPAGDQLPGYLIGRTYAVDPPSVQGTQQEILTLGAANDPQCLGLFGGRSTCFTILWTPNGPRHINDPGARGSALIVDGNLVLGFAWIPYGQSCEGSVATYAIEDAGATLRGIDPPVCTYPGFRAP